LNRIESNRIESNRIESNHSHPIILPQILEEHRKNCEQQGKYVEAEIAKNRLDELKAHEEKRQSEAMRASQISDMLGVEEAHMLEFKQFNMAWDKTMTEYEEKTVL